jgi:hypothetical protein
MELIINLYFFEINDIDKREIIDVEIQCPYFNVSLIELYPEGICNR